jgi:hypothetical protein
VTALNRQPIYDALFAFFSGLTVGGSPAFKKATKKVTTWESVLAEDTPALLMQERGEEAQYRKGLPTIWRLRVNLYVYVHTGANNDPDLVPADIINPLLDLVDASIAIDDVSNEACTLGGLVSHVAIEGSIERYQGDLGDDAVVVIPITVLTSP